MKKKYLALALLALTGVAFADPTPPNECGNHGNNCENDGGNGGSSTSTSEATANSSAVAGAISNSSVGDIKNSNSNLNISAGGQGGEGGRGGDGGTGYGGAGLGFGGEAAQDQQQDQEQGQHQSASSTQSQNASNNGVSNSTTIKTERNAPPVYLGNISATVSCAGGFNVGGSDRNGAGALGFTWISSDCKSVVAGQNMQVLGMVDVACKIFKTTDGFKRAAARDPSLEDVDCTKAER